MKHITFLFLAALCAVSAFGSTFTGTVVSAKGKPIQNAVVWLEGSPKSRPMSKAIIDQRDRKFVPHVSVVTVGTTISFPNNDYYYHNVFAEFDAKKFDLGMYPRGSSKEQKFSKPGLVALLCSVHSEMSAYVMVVDTPYYAVTNSKGEFSIPSIEAGSYDLKAWHESGKSTSLKLTVATSNLTQKIVLGR